MVSRDITGQRFGRLTVWYKLRGARPSRWFCVCDCGREKEARLSNLSSGHVQSCGCLNSELSATRCESRARHGYSRTREWNSFMGAKRRCTDPRNHNFKRYGARGIRFCFTTFEQFFAELGPRPVGKSVDRINNDGHYAPGNVRWATPKEQAGNRRKHDCIC